MLYVCFLRQYFQKISIYDYLCFYFSDYFALYSLAKEMDEKRAAAAALGYPQSTMNKDDRQLYGDGVSISVQSSTTAGSEKQLPSTTDAQWQQNLSEDNEGQYDFVPHFQRVSIGGEDNNGVIIYNYVMYLCN